ELHARVLEGLETTLVGRVLRLVRPARPEQEAEQLRRDTHGRADHDEEDDREIGFEIHDGCRSQDAARRSSRFASSPKRLAIKHLVPTARLELAQLSPLPPQDSV